MSEQTPRETAIAIRQRCLVLHKTMKRVFREAGVPRHKYDFWRFKGIKPKAEDLAKLRAVLEGYENAK